MGAEIRDNDEISTREREKLLKSLHSSLFWVGEEIPYKVMIDGNEVNLHEIVWEIVNKPNIERSDVDNIDKLLELLSAKEKEYEDCLEHGNVSSDEANEIFEKAAGVRRAIMDLKELTTSAKRKAIFKCRHICDNVETCEWDSLAEDMKDKCWSKRS
ncbi:hypothetical protein SAMN04488589_1263 [Methanolobus vulcani]|jgi:hypothetical protein|uniref:Uncharacterized protein n=1 Tax=Methanolobus vulcani TaxID=38026 RepID=A0A7Z7AW54_9EURY|nr:DUF5788 family protein [Methanolobus vulcani]MDK2826424.1 hypothetical protein [Methanolobus sp.]SDF73013.1 hypothetical protein SAMN04488589_1263 [Methanolobus vulcani]